MLKKQMPHRIPNLRLTMRPISQPRKRLRNDVGASRPRRMLNNSAEGQVGVEGQVHRHR
jgi:hypothetical protein